MLNKDAAAVLTEALKEAVDVGNKTIFVGDEEAEALRMAVAALMKQVPMRVTNIHVDEYYCPECGAENGCNDCEPRDDFCPVCGQALLVGGELDG